MKEGRERACFTLCLVLQALVFAGAATAAQRGQPPSIVVFGIALSFVPYVGALASLRAMSAVRAPELLAVAATSALGAVWLFAPPALSDDIYRYLWEGRLWLSGFNPYAVAPDDPSLAPLRDSVWASINNKPLATIYPPLAQLLFATAAWLGGGILTVKLLALAGLAVTAGWVTRVTGELRVGLAVGLNPLLSAESALNGHFDVLVGAALFTAAWALSGHRFARAGVAIAAAVGIKVVGLVALPLLWRRPRVLLATAFASALLLAPLVWSRAPTDASSGTGQFLTRWRGNDSIFALVDWLSQQLLAEGVAGLAARVVVAGILLGVIAMLLQRRVPAARATRILVWTVLLLSPQVHPWYLGWLLPLELAAGGHAALIWSAAVLSAYAPLDAWVNSGVWHMPPWMQILEYVLVGVALLFDFRSNSKWFG